MDWNRAIRDERAMTQRIVALLLALADMAERASGRSAPVCAFLVWILRPADAAMSSWLDLPPDDTDGLDIRSIAILLALRLRFLAEELLGEVGLSSGFATGLPAERRPHKFGIGELVRGLAWSAQVMKLDTS
jgi:hypothetical protein